jgi:hypothetical protein
MRDINRIPEILKELEKVWMENPDYRLGQLITVATRPSISHPTTFYIEDDKMLNGLKSFGTEEANENSSIAYWDKYPNVSRMKPEDITIELVKEFVSIIKKDKSKFVITPKKLMELDGAPVSDENWLKGQQSRINKLESLLRELKDKSLLEEIQIGYGVKE